MSADLVLEYLLAAALAVAMARIGFLEGKLRTVMAIDALRAVLVERLRTHLADTVADIAAAAKPSGPRRVVPVLETECSSFKLEKAGRVTGVVVHVNGTLLARWDTPHWELEAGDKVDIGLRSERER